MKSISLKLTLAILALFALACGNCNGDEVEGDLPCKGPAAHFPLGKDTLDIQHSGDDGVLRRWYVFNVQPDGSGFCSVNSGDNAGKRISISCLEPKSGILEATVDCPVQRECLFEEDGSQCSRKSSKKAKKAEASDEKAEADKPEASDEPKADGAKPTTDSDAEMNDNIIRKSAMDADYRSRENEKRIDALEGKDKPKS
ncbi:MAG: hypothetical protein ABIA47_01565 [bacterium]